MNPPLQIIADSREQLPYDFAGYPVTATRGVLPSGDYSLLGHESTIALERKSLDDLLGCLTRERGRFERELARLAGYTFAAVIVEAGFVQFVQGRYRSRMNPRAALASITAFHVRYGVAFLFAGDRAGGERLTYELLRRLQAERLSHAEREPFGAGVL